MQQGSKPVFDSSPWDALGLVPWLAGVITQEAVFAVDMTNRRLYVLDGSGRYRPHARWHIERRTTRLCQDHGVTRFWGPYLGERVAKFIAATAPGLETTRVGK
jgi:hypothetical protein